MLRKCNRECFARCIFHTTGHSRNTGGRALLPLKRSDRGLAMQARRPSRTNEWLLSYSAEHVAYEVEMLLAVQHLGVELYRCAPSERERWLAQCLLAEGRALHSRVLIEFLVPGPASKDTDVIASEFVDDWQVEPAQRAGLSRVRERGHKEVAHLTELRISGAPPDKEWTDDDLRPVWSELARFSGLASPLRLHENVRVRIRQAIALGYC